MSCSLAFIPINKVEDCFEHLLDTEPDLPAVSLTPYLDYLAKTWIEGIYDLSFCNLFDNEGDRTNNPLEGFNLGLNKSVDIHSNIWKFISEIANIECRHSIRYERIEDDTLHERNRNKKDLVRDIDLLKAKNKYLQDNDIMTYWKEVSDLMPEFEEV